MTDVDEDGYGDSYPSNSSIAGSDCDDSNIYTYPGAASTLSSLICAKDEDGDGYAAAVAGENVTLGDDCDDIDPTLNAQDADGDGQSSCDGDCNESDIQIYSGAPEISLDGVDQNCDGVDGEDGDGDGQASLASGGQGL